MTRAYIDTCVFIDAIKGSKPHWQQALALFTDPGRELVSSQLIRLGLLPGPTFGKNANEVQNIESLLGAISVWVEVDDDLIREAVKIGCDHGVAGVDAVHCAAAKLAGACLITSERVGTPMHRVKDLITIHVDAT